MGENNDVVALAQTGTGKTAAFGLPLIQQINVNNRIPQSLILCPTRELCLQIAGDLNDYSKYIDGLRVLPVYGGSSIESQIRALKRGVHIIVATPGRLLDLMERKTVSLSTIQNVVMDEADEMLNMGFTDSINAILADVPQERNTLLFSATMSPEIARISKKYLHNAKEITIGRKNESTSNVKHVVFTVHAKDKYAALKRIVDYYPQIYGIIFCRTRKETQEIADKLMQEGYNADSLHGELSQAQRDTVMQKFRIRNLQLLVATDVAARGLDVDDLTHVINYGLPDDTESYTHRSGRTGRAGKTGTSIAIINLREKGKMREIERIIGKKFIQGEMPTGKQICEKQLLKVIDELEKVKVNEDGKMQAITTLQNMIINLGKEYYANVLTIANGTTLSTKVEKSTQGMGGQTVDVEVPEKILFDLPQLDENNSTVLSITVDFMNAMMGQGNDYPTNVTLTLDLDNVQHLQKEYVLEDGTYNVPVDVLKENNDDQSMAAKAIESAQINVNNNEVTVTLKLKEMTMYGQTASVDKMEYQLKDGTYQEATIIEEENGHPTKVQFKLDQNVKLTNVKFYYGGSNRGATARLSLDLDHLTKVIPSRFNQDGTYSVDVALWNATSDKASMAAAALDSKAKIIVKDGKATMYISTKEMSFGTIKASLQEFYIGSAQEDYKNHSATIIEKDTQGNPTLWSFELPHEDEYINVMMNPHVAMMGNMDLEARIKVDYSTLTYISDKTELETNTKKEDPKENNQNQASNTATENKTETTKDNQQESQAVKTGDQAPITMMSVLGMISLFMFVVLQKKYEA